MALEIHEIPESPLDLALKQHRWLGLVVSMKWSRAAVQVFLHEQKCYEPQSHTASNLV